jgi:UDP-glucose 4-epimerase
MRRVLVTGGAGFIGSHVCDQLLERGYRVTVLDDLSGGFRANVPERAEFVQGSITDADLVNRVFRDGRFEYVCHFGAYAAEGLSHFIKRFNYTNNLIGSVNLINASINEGVKCFVLPMTEETRPHPEDPYGIAKLAVEQELAVSHRMFGLDYVVFRPHNVYGERQNIGDRYRNVVGIFMNQLLQGQPMSVFGDGQQSRAFSYIGDIAPILADALETPAAYNQVFNIGADEPYTVLQLAEAVAAAMGVPAQVQHLASRDEVKDAYSSHDKTNRIFGARPHTSLEEGLQRMARWVREHGARVGSKFEGIEVERNLPAVWRA